jgi:hypothetical protein
MFCLNDTMRYHLCPGRTDMRKGINSLIGVVKEKMGSDVRNGVSINSSTPFGGCRSVVILLRAKLHNLQPLRL